VRSKLTVHEVAVIIVIRAFMNTREGKKRKEGRKKERET
jgi:hypothetical protein